LRFLKPCPSCEAEAIRLPVYPKRKLRLGNIWPYFLIRFAYGPEHLHFEPAPWRSDIRQSGAMQFSPTFFELPRERILPHPIRVCGGIFAYMACRLSVPSHAPAQSGRPHIPLLGRRKPSVSLTGLSFENTIANALQISYMDVNYIG